jgi:hypothetical protein
MADIMPQVYQGLIEKGSNLVGDFQQGYNWRTQLDAVKAKQVLAERTADLEAKKIEVDTFKALGEAKFRDQEIQQQAIGHAITEQNNLSNQGLKKLELDLQTTKTKAEMDHWAADYGIKILDLQYKKKDLEVKLQGKQQELLKPTLDRYGKVISECNVLRGRAFSGQIYGEDDASYKKRTGDARAQLDQKMQEANNLASVIDKAAAYTTSTDPTGGSQVPPGKPTADAIQQRARDSRIADTTEYMSRAKVGANVKVNTFDSNPQIQQLKQDAVGPVLQLKAKTQAQIQAIEQKYYKQLETDPYAAPPTNQVEALLHGMNNKIQLMRRNNKYLQGNTVDTGNLNAVLFGGDVNTGVQ